MKPIVFGLALLVAGATAALAADAGNPGEQLVVPLSDPSRPATVKVSLVQGSITVESYDGKEIVISGRNADEDEDMDGQEAAEIARAEADRARARAERQKERHDRNLPKIAGEDAAADARSDRSHLRKIPNASMGLEASEENNVVTVGSNSWSQAIELHLKVPRSASLQLSTVNGGDIEIANAVDGELDLHNTNGGITVKDAKGPIVAATVNGPVIAVLRKGASAAPMAFSTLNGDVDVTLPSDFKADLRMRSDNGEIYADFDVAIERQPAKIQEERKGNKYKISVGREVLGKINGGGPEILFKTFNGDIVLRAAKP
jgi:hypothetical protein